MPNVAHFCHNSCENSSFLSRSITSSFSSSLANRNTSLRKAACSSFHAKSKACLSPVLSGPSALELCNQVMNACATELGLQNFSTTILHRLVMQSKKRQWAMVHAPSTYQVY